jgi:hypothetical protein
VFSKHRAVKMLSRKSASAVGLIPSPSVEQSDKVQKVGQTMSCAPCAISSRKASGKAMSQQMSRPTLPSGVSKTSCGSRVEEVRWSRSMVPLRRWRESVTLILEKEERGNVPEVLLDVFAYDGSVVVDEVGHVEELVFILLSVAVSFYYRAWYDADVAFFCESLVFLEIRLPLVTAFEKTFEFRDPVG